MAKSNFNPYREWLGLTAAADPDYYRLLGVERDETSPERLAVAADRAVARVRSFRPGPHAREWMALLDQLAAAKACLTDPQRRAAYDRLLQPAPESPPEPGPRDRAAGVARHEMAAETIEQHQRGGQPPRSAPPAEFLLPPNRSPSSSAVPQGGGDSDSPTDTPTEHALSPPPGLGDAPDSVVPFLEPVDDPTPPGGAAIPDNLDPSLDSNSPVLEKVLPIVAGLVLGLLALALLALYLKLGT